MRNEKKLRERIRAYTLREYMKLVKWLYDNHLDVLREYEDINHGGKQIDFV